MLVIGSRLRHSFEAYLPICSLSAILLSCCWRFAFIGSNERERERADYEISLRRVKVRERLTNDVV